MLDKAAQVRQLEQRSQVVHQAVDRGYSATFSFKPGRVIAKGVTS
jgi:hypothetical protein